MKINSIITAIAALCALVGTAVAGFIVNKNDSNRGDSANHPSESGDTMKTSPHSWPAVVDLRTQLAGTSWKAINASSLRPGLSATLSFDGRSEVPEGYRYECNSHDSTVTVFFNHGDTQLMLLTDNGKILRPTFRGQDFGYELVGKSAGGY